MEYVLRGLALFFGSGFLMAFIVVEFLCLNDAWADKIHKFSDQNPLDLSWFLSAVFLGFCFGAGWGLIFSSGELALLMGAIGTCATLVVNGTIPFLPNGRDLTLPEEEKFVAAIAASVTFGTLLVIALSAPNILWDPFVLGIALAIGPNMAIHGIAKSLDLSLSRRN